MVDVLIEEESKEQLTLLLRANKVNKSYFFCLLENIWNLSVWKCTINEWSVIYDVIVKVWIETDVLEKILRLWN